MDTLIAPGDFVKVEGDNQLYQVDRTISGLAYKNEIISGPQARLRARLTGKIRWVSLTDKRTKITKLA